MSPSCPYILYSLNILLMYVMNVQKFNAIKQSDNKITSVKRDRERERSEGMTSAKINNDIFLYMVKLI